MLTVKSHYLALDAALPGPVVEVKQDDLLPGAQKQAVPGNGDGQRRFEKRGPDMGIAVAVAPAAVMLVGEILGKEALDGSPQIVDHAGLEFDGAQGRGGPGDEEGKETIRHLRLCDPGANCVCEVQYVSPGGGADFQGERF